MINGARTWIAGGVFALMLAVYLGDGARIARLEERRRRAEALVPGGAEALTEFGVGRGGRLTLFRKTGDAWRMVEPIEDLADPEWIARAMDALDKQTITHPMAAGAAAMARYGLAQTGLWIELPRVAGGTGPKPVKLLIGDDAPVAGRVYARLDGADEVFTITSTLRDLVRRDINEFRDHRVLPVDPTGATVLEITSEGRSVKMVKTEEATRSGNWKMIAPEAVPADEETINGILQELQTARAIDFITTGRLELEGLGLAAPSLVVSLVAPKENPDLKPTTLAIGRRTLDAPPAYYAQAAGSQRVFTAPQSLIDKLRVTPLDLRAKSLFNLTPERVARFTFRYGGSAVRLAKDDAGAWALEAPDSGEVDQAMIDKILKALLRTRAAGYISTQPIAERSGMDNPLIVATFADADGGAVEGIEIGRPAPGKSRAYARLTGGGEVFLVDDEVLNRYFFLHDDFLVRKVFKFDAASAAKVELRESTKVWAFEKQGDGWLYTPGASDKSFQIKSAFVERFLLATADLRWKRRLEPAVAEDAPLIKKHGLEEPALTIRVLDASGAELAALGQGGNDDARVYIRAGAGDYYVLEVKDYQGFLLALKAMLNAR